KEAFDRFLHVLQQTEWAPPAHLLRYQEGLLAKLAHHAYENVPFYRDRLACLFAAGAVDLSRWNEVPLLTRAQAAAATRSMRSRELDAIYGDVSEHRTSGSTGESLS